MLILDTEKQAKITGQGLFLVKQPLPRTLYSHLLARKVRMPQGGETTYTIGKFYTPDSVYSQRTKIRLCLI